MIAALFVETNGCYFGLPDVDPWDQARDARLYAGPHPVIAHPPCQRWGRFWHGSTRKPHQFSLGDDGGCFRAAFHAAQAFGGIVEQGHYGHFARKPTWLYAAHIRPLLDLAWGPSPQRLPAYAVERYGYEKARRIGVVAAIGGKDKTKIRNATPLPFRDLLISLASAVDIKERYCG